MNDPRWGEPGRTEWEGFETATKAAAAGGITTLVDMPLNSLPVTTTLDALKTKLDAAEGKLFVDCGFHAGLIPGNADRLPALIDAGVLGVKAFLVHSGIDEFPNATEDDLRAEMPLIAQSGLPLLVHAELPSILHPDAVSRDEESEPHNYQILPPTSRGQNYGSYLSSRPRSWEQNAIELMIKLCREYNCRTHILHLSSADAVPALRNARAAGLPITVETCPHYLYFTGEEVPDGDTRFKCAPPIREQENRERLSQALSEGVIDFIVSDHSPCPPEMKCMTSGDFQKAWGGIASLQLGLSIVWTEARRRGCTIENIAAWMSRRPAELVGLDNRKGAISPGFDADLVVWNPDQEFNVTTDKLFHRHKITPYQDRMLAGTIEQTYVRGTRVFHNGEITGQPTGSLLTRHSHEMTTKGTSGR
jgi:allantoinase